VPSRDVNFSDTAAITTSATTVTMPATVTIVTRVMVGHHGRWKGHPKVARKGPSGRQETSAHKGGREGPPKAYKGPANGGPKTNYSNSAGQQRKKVLGRRDVEPGNPGRFPPGNSNLREGKGFFPKFFPKKNFSRPNPPKEIPTGKEKPFSKKSLHNLNRGKNQGKARNPEGLRKFLLDWERFPPWDGDWIWEPAPPGEVPGGDLTNPNTHLNTTGKVFGLEGGGIHPLF